MKHKCKYVVGYALVARKYVETPKVNMDFNGIIMNNEDELG